MEATASEMKAMLEFGMSPAVGGGGLGVEEGWVRLVGDARCLAPLANFTKLPCPAASPSSLRMPAIWPSEQNVMAEPMKSR